MYFIIKKDDDTLLLVNIISSTEYIHFILDFIVFSVTCVNA